MITPPLKKHFVLIFESVVTVFLSLEEDVQNVKNFYNQLFTQVHNVIANGGSANINVTKGALYVSQVALQSIRSQSILKGMFEGVAKTLCKLVDDHIASLGIYPRNNYTILINFFNQLQGAFVVTSPQNH